MADAAAVAGGVEGLEHPAMLVEEGNLPATRSETWMPASLDRTSTHNSPGCPEFATQILMPKRRRIQHLT